MCYILFNKEVDHNSLILQILYCLYHIFHQKIIARANTDCKKCSRNESGLPIIIMGPIIGIQIILFVMTPFITIFIYKKCKFILVI